MAIEIKDYLDVAQRAADLGLPPPLEACILPRTFDSASDFGDLVHESSTLDLKTLFRQATLPISEYQPSQTRIPYLQENDITWVGPLLFFSAAALSDNPHLLNASLGVIGNYLTELFKGSASPVRTRLSIVLETIETRTTKKTTKRIDYDGPLENLSEINRVLKELRG